jgi:hypothetical protein
VPGEKSLGSSSPSGKQLPLAKVSPPGSVSGPALSLSEAPASSVLGVPLCPEGQLGLQFPLKVVVPWLDLTLQEQLPELEEELLELVPCEDPETLQVLAFAICVCNGMLGITNNASVRRRNDEETIAGLSTVPLEPPHVFWLFK